MKTKRGTVSLGKEKTAGTGSKKVLSRRELNPGLERDKLAY